MSATTKIALGVTAGYLLGRMHKLRLAITVGGLLAGQRLATNPQALMQQGSKLVDSNPELRKLRGQITGRLLDAARDAALTTATSRLEAMTDSLTALPGARDEEDEYDDAEDEEPQEDEYDDAEDEEPQEDEDAAEGRSSGRRRSASAARRGSRPSRASASSSGRSTAKKAGSTAKKGSSSGSGAAKKSSSRASSGARKSASSAKKTGSTSKKAAKKAPASKSAAKKSSSGRRSAKKTTSSRR